MYLLHLLGSVRLKGPAGVLTGAVAQHRQLAFLAVLEAAGDEGVSRDRLLARLWPERTTASARRSLVDATYRLRSALGEDAVLAEGNVLRLNPRVVKSDLRAFEALLDQGELEQAVALYRGPFLDAFHLRDSHDFEEWRDAEARRLSRQYGEALEELARRAERQEAYRTAADLWERLAGHDPFNTRFTVGWMRALSRAGDPGNAIRAGEEHVLLLRRELGAEAPASILDLLERFRKAEEAPAAEVPVPLPFETGFPEPPLPPAFPFVGREEELTRLEPLLDRALAGQGSVVFITGEAGTGKTALAAEFCRRAAEVHPELVIAGGNGNAHTGQGDPYLPFREVLALLTGDVESRYGGGSLSREQAARLWNLIPVSVAALLAVGPDLVDTFLSRTRLHSRVSAFARHATGGEGTLASLGEQIRAPQPPAAQQAQALFLQFARTLHAVARVHPILLLLDDLQWFDSGSVGLLFQLARQLQGSRVLVLGLFRPSDVALGRDGTRHPLEPVVNELRRSYGEIEIPLGEGGDRALVEALVDAEPNALGRGFRETLFRQTGGHALFTVELLRAMRDRGALVRDEEGRWAESECLRWDVLPARLEAVIGERIARVPAVLRRLLSIASLEGEEFTLEAVARVQGADIRDLAEAVREELEKRHRLVVFERVRHADERPLSVYRFRHILFQRFLYDRLDVAERLHGHEQLGLALEDLYGAQVEDIALELARHFREANLSDPAARYFLAAGIRCMRTGGFPEAVAHLESSLDLLRFLPSGRERDTRELEALIALGNARHLAFAPGQADAFRRAEEMAREVEDPRQLAWALLGQCVVLHYAADHREVARLGEECLVLAEAEGDVGLQVATHAILALAAVSRGDYGSSLEHCAAVLSRHDPANHLNPLFLSGIDLGILSRSLTAYGKLCLGYPDQAAEWSRDALALARKERSRITVVYVYYWDVQVLMGRGELEAALQQLEKWREAAAEAGVLGFWSSWIDIFEGWCRARIGDGDPESAMRLAEGGLERVLEMGFRGQIPGTAALVGQVLSLGGRAEEGLALLDEARASSVATDEMAVESDILRMRGELLLAQPCPSVSEAESSFRQAIELARAQEARLFELRATTSLARLLRDQGKTREARTALQEIHDWFTEGFETADFKEAAAVLEELEQSG